MGERERLLEKFKTLAEKGSAGERDRAADVKNMTPMELASAAIYVRSGWKNIYTQELCRRAGLLERYLNTDNTEASDIVRRAAKSFGIKLI